MAFGVDISSKSLVVDLFVGPLHESLEVPLGVDFNWIFNADSVLVNYSELDCFVGSCVSVEKSFKDSQDSFFGCFFTAIFLPHCVEDWPREIIAEPCRD